jgi:aryl-alcohol dehydrogenase-like predicted oxidoreductase
MEPLTVFDDPSHPILGLAELKSSDLSFLDMAFDEGYRVLDTAPVYGLGASEKALGRWIRMRRNRESLVIITKGGHPSLWRPWRHRITVESIERDLSTSLKRLGCDYIDLYMLHRDASECDVPAVLQYLHEQTRVGRVRRLGVSNWRHERIREANAVARRLGLSELSASSPAARPSDMEPSAVARLRQRIRQSGRGGAFVVSRCEDTGPGLVAARRRPDPDRRRTLDAERRVL